MTAAGPLLESVDRNETESTVGRRGRAWLAVLLFVATITFETATHWASQWTMPKDLELESSSVPHNVTNEPMAARNKTSINIPEIIMSPDVMYQQFGMVSPPILGVSLKAFFNFGVQTTLLLGWDVCQGKAVIKNRLDAEAHFGKLAIGFQVVGQASAVYSYGALSQVTQPWKGGTHLEAFSFLVSQHSSSITIVVGLCNNMIMPYFTKSENEAHAAKVLTITGLVIGTPIWTSIATAGFPVIFVYCGIGLAGAVLVEFLWASLKGEWSLDEYLKYAKTAPAFTLVKLLFFGTFALSLIFLVLGMWTHPLYSFMNTGAFLVELLLPYILLVLLYGPYLDIEQEGVGYATLMAFGIGLSVVYLISTLVPTAILTWHNHVTDAAPLAFWGKNICAYFTYTFLWPAARIVASATTNAVEYSQVVAIWLSEIIGLPA